MTDAELLKALRAPIDKEIRPGQGGKPQKYIPHQNVSDRLIEVFGLGNWNFEILREIIEPKEAVTVIRLHYKTEEGWRYKDAYAGKVREPSIALGNTLKACASLAIVKAASLLGIDTREEDLEMATDEQIQIIVELLKKMGKPVNAAMMESFRKLPVQEADKLIESLQGSLKK